MAAAGVRQPGSGQNGHVSQEEGQGLEDLFALVCGGFLNCVVMGPGVSGFSLAK